MVFSPANNLKQDKQYSSKALNPVSYPTSRDVTLQLNQEKHVVVNKLIANMCQPSKMRKGEYVSKETVLLHRWESITGNLVLTTELKT